MFEQFLQELKEKSQDTFVMHRFNKCVECSCFDKQRMICKECGCYIRAKVLFPTSKCPLRKW
jgi:hypothetical protein